MHRGPWTFISHFSGSFSTQNKYIFYTSIIICKKNPPLQRVWEVGFFLQIIYLQIIYCNVFGSWYLIYHFIVELCDLLQHFELLTMTKCLGCKYILFKCLESYRYIVCFTQNFELLTRKNSPCHVMQIHIIITRLRLYPLILSQRLVDCSGSS